ncbi:MAG: coproporphyrinogen III oxidase, partial [Sediminibacterium sp.]
LVGLGVSAISDAGMGYAQNEKTLHDYYNTIAEGKLAVVKGYLLTAEDSNFRKYILDISCRGKTEFTTEDLALLKTYSFPYLAELALDGLINFTETSLEVTQRGMHFIRNICYAFDLHVHRKKTESAMPLFSKAI